MQNFVQFLGAVNWKWKIRKPSGLQNLAGKTVVITGATSGIGNVTAIELAKLGAKVIYGARNLKKAQETKDELVRHSSHPDKIFYYDLELESLESVKEFAEKVKENHPEIDILILNAGLILKEKRFTKDNFEATFQINHLAHFYLTHLLKNNLTQCARIISTSSLAHLMSPNITEKLLGSICTPNENAPKYNDWVQYRMTKLCNILFTLKLREIFEGTKVTANAFSPGIVATGFSREMWLDRAYTGMSNLLFANSKEGSYTMTHLAASAEADGITGQYWELCNVSNYSQSLVTQEAVDILHQFSLDCLKLDSF